MKIYPGNHGIISTEDITTNHIPLAYFEAKNVVKDIKIKISDSYIKENKKEKIYPYQYFNSNNICLFDKNDNKIDSSIYLKRNGNQYFFEPRNSIEFTPQTFVYSVLMARQDSFKNNIKYNIKVGVDSLEMAENLLGIFNSLTYSKPNNISFNDNSLLPSSLINMSISEPDFLFIGEDYLNILTENEWDIIFNNHTNVWIAYDKLEDIIIEDRELKEYELEHSEVYSSSIFLAKEGSKYKIDINKEIEGFPRNSFEYINLFINECPVLILKKENNSFIIISHKSFIDRADNYRLFYEILMRIYLNSYVETKTRTSLIADYKIDYFIKVYQKFNKYHPDINLNKIFYEDKINARIKSNIVTVKLDKDSEGKIQFLGTDKYNNLLFKSNAGTDPVKEKNTISVFTTKDTIIYYNLDENELYLVEDILKINYQIINDKNYIIIDTFRSSDKNIILKKPQYIEIPDINKYLLIYDYVENKFTLSNNLTLDNYAAEIQFILEEDLTCKDIRIIGGGEADSEPNYDMIDTGSLKGRPYRVGSTMIIKMPLRYKEYEDILLYEIKKHMSSADYPILIFQQ